MYKHPTGISSYPLIKTKKVVETNHARAIRAIYMQLYFTETIHASDVKENYSLNP